MKWYYSMCIIFCLGNPIGIKAQSDTLTYRVGMGVSVIKFWDNGHLGYRERLRRNLASDIIFSENLFINNFTMDVKTQYNDHYGRLSYLFSNDVRGKISIRSVILSFGSGKSFFRNIVDINSEIGLGYSLLIDSEALVIKNEVSPVGGIGFDINIWKGIYLDNRIRALYSFNSKKVYVSHTISLSYNF